MTDPLDLIRDARTLASISSPRLGTSVNLMASILLRQALEASLSTLWSSIAPTVGDVSMRVQLIALPAEIDEQVAQDAGRAWALLSAACHHQPYELPPPQSAVMHLSHMVERVHQAVVARLSAHQRDGRST